jgi:hypothetical protein
MAKDAQVMTSRWLLVAAAGLAVVAAIAVNLYIGSVKDKYEGSAFTVLRVKKDVPANHKVTADDVELVSVPLVFKSAFDQAFKGVEGKNWFIGGKPTRRALNNGDILFHGDFQEMTAPPPPVNPPPGTEYVALPIDKASSPGAQLTPGGYVSVRGRFVINPGEKEKVWATMTVYDCIQVRTLDDQSVPPPAANAGGYSRIGVFVKKDQAKALSDIISKAEGRRLTIGITVPVTTEQATKPEIDPVLMKLIAGNKAPAESDLTLPE